MASTAENANQVIMSPLSGSSPRTAWCRFAVHVVCVTCVFAAAWIPLAKAAFGGALHSYAAAIPLVCGWLIWQRGGEFSAIFGPPARVAAFVLLGAATVAGVFGAAGRRMGWIESETGWLASQILGWVLGIWAGACWCFGRNCVRTFAFPWAYLIFTVPLPPWLVDAVETGLQRGSAAAVEAVFRLGRVTFTRDEVSFWLPGLRFDIAPECSGIRSTLVLFLTSLLGAYLLLRSPWRRAALVALILPLGIARNTLRICTITLLSVHVDPTIIDSPLHHRGGPVFFVVSLIPFFVLLLWFRRQEERPAVVPVSVTETARATSCS